ncbi:MAG: BatD family protein [Candidatus Wallbacteria bacterium]|nr:BatD family protein [Candidatus Wallbacteria bacterium]
MSRHNSPLSSVRQRRRPRGSPFGDDPFEDPFFDRFFGRNFQVRHEALHAPAIQVRVPPLPAEGRPPGFSGTIADGLSISSGLDRKTAHGSVKEPIRETDALSFRVVLSGRGDIRNIPKPDLKLGDSFKEYESKATPEIKIDEKGMFGRKTFEFVLVPRRSGALEIAPVEVSYFDSATRKYRTLRTEPIRIDVTPGEKEERLTSGSVSRQQDVKMLGADIRYISEGPAALEDRGPELQRRRWLLALDAAAAVAFLFAVWRARRLRALARDPAMARRLGAARTAREALNLARQELEQGKTETVHGRLEEALLHFLADKLDVPANAIVIENADEFLAVRGLDSSRARAVQELLAAFQASRYSGGRAAPDRLEADLGATERIVADLEAAL